MLKRRLSQKEIDKKLGEVRGSYRAFIKEYKKSDHLLASFNERYFTVLRNRQNLRTFFEAEASALGDLKDRELDKRGKLQERKVLHRQPPIEKKDTAQRVWEEHRRKIVKYPSCGFHSEASEDVDHLLGALGAFREEHWPRLEWAFRTLTPRRNEDILVDLEMRWRDFCIPGSDGIPPRIWKYRALLSRIPREEEAIEWEERQILFDCAQFLGRLRNAVGELLYLFPKKDRKWISRNQEELDAILADFRLFDLLRLAT